MTAEERRERRAARNAERDRLGVNKRGGIKTVKRRKKRTEKVTLTKTQVDRVIGIMYTGADLGTAARVVGSTRARLYLLMDTNPDFREAVLEARNYADERVVSALYKKAINGDVRAMIFWLKNRKRHEWRDQYEHSVVEPERRGPHVVVFATGDAMPPAAAGLPAAYSDQPGEGRPDDQRPAGGKE